MVIAEMQFRHDLEKDYYARAWPTHALPYRHLEPYLRSWLLKPSELFDQKTVVDIGAGEATYTRLIGEIFTPKVVLGCELFAERMLPAARANQNPNVLFITGDAFHLPIKESSVDTVFGSLVLHQLPDLACALGEVSRVLRVGGCYVGIESNPYNPVILYRYLRGSHSRNQYLLTESDVRQSFEAAGFSVSVRYFFARRPALRGRLLGTCMGILARKDA
jgi:ubiquinone/menaquinone biosynthesis C-methylase UbiE